MERREMLRDGNPHPPKKVMIVTFVLMIVTLPFWTWRGFFVGGQFDVLTLIYVVISYIAMILVTSRLTDGIRKMLSRVHPMLLCYIGLIIISVAATVINWGFLGRIGYPIGWRFYVFEGILVFTISQLVYLLCNRLVLTSDIVLGIVYAFNIANYYVNLFRGEPLAPWDYQALGTAGEVAGSYSFQCTSGIVIGYAILFCSYYLMSMLTIAKDNRSKNKTVVEIIVFIAVLTVYICAVYPAMMPQRVMPIRNYTSNGSLSGYVAYNKANNARVTDYTDEKAEAILKKTQIIQSDKDSVQPVNIIMIMNESFGDLRCVGKSLDKREGYIVDDVKAKGLREEVDSCLGYIDSLSDNTVKGNLYVDVYGGGTCNSEFEALTGISNRYYPGYPYEYAIKSQVSSLASLLNDAGYGTSASHPSKPSNYDRIHVYPYLGFQDTAFFPDLDKGMKECFRAWSGNNIISDSMDYKWIEQMQVEQYSSKNGNFNKNFMFNVSIQNHSPYTYTEGKDSYKVNVDLSKYGDLPETEIYLTLMKESDKALRELVEYYSSVDEPALICFFGDHQAMVESKTYDILYGSHASELSDQQIQQKYITPFIMWANYDIQEEYVDKISANYLGMKLLEVANIDMDSFYSYLHELYKKWPVITTLGMYDSEGHYYEPNSNVDKSGSLLEYRYLQEYRIRGN